MYIMLLHLSLVSICPTWSCNRTSFKSKEKRSLSRRSKQRGPSENAVNHTKKSLRLTWRTLHRCWSACTSPCHCYAVHWFHPPHPPNPTHRDKKGCFLELGLPLNKQNRLTETNAPIELLSLVLRRVSSCLKHVVAKAEHIQ